ncbi:MAG: hypothetical protein AAF558_03340, partial [Verrucomicrobiota bacterium]
PRPRRAWLKRIAIGVTLFVLIRFIQADLLLQGLHLRGLQHDLAITNRILYRIENLPNLSLDKTYRVIFLGNLPSVRKKWFDKLGPDYDIAGAAHIPLSFPQFWNPEAAMNLLGSKVRLQSGLTTREKEMAKVREDFARRKPGKWPKPGSVFVIDDLIVVNLNSDLR